MAYDKVVDSVQLDADLKVVADAIRSKSGTTEQLSFPQGMKQAVDSIQSGGAVGLPMWNGLITQTSDVTYMNITHNLNSDKLLIIAELVDVTTRHVNYQPYRIIGWSPEVLTPHKKYAYGDYTNEAYADESVAPTTNRTVAAMLDSNGSSATALRVVTQNRNMNNNMIHSDGNNKVMWYVGANFGVATWNVTVIDISNAGISFSE